MPDHRHPRARRRPRAEAGDGRGDVMSYEDSPYPLRDAVTPAPPPDTRWLQTPVRAFMRPGVVSLAEDASLHQVQRAMVAHGVHAVLITAASGPVGWATATGLLPWLKKETALYSAGA